MKKHVSIIILFFTFVSLFAQQNYNRVKSKKIKGMEKNQEKTKIRIDIISDIVCPWCYIGYHRLQKALSLINDKIEAEIHWHPYILNEHYPEGGVNYKQHLIKKYGRTAKQVDEVRAHHTSIGKELGFEFSYFEGMKTYNSIKGHQLVRLAREYGKEVEMKVRLMTAFFGERKNISDISTLLKEAKVVGLDVKRSEEVLEKDEYVEDVLNEINSWKSTGVNGVPTYIINQKHMISGAQNPQYFANVLLSVAKED